MKLSAIRVQNFKSIEDSEQFSVGPITALVGKNESGKSALLEALYKFNPVIETDGTFDPPITFYPRRRWSDYKDRHATSPDNVLTTEWQVEPADHAAVE